jgi:hypothetical protein
MIKITQPLFNVLELRASRLWRRHFSVPGALVGLLSKVQLVLLGFLTKESCIAGYLLSKEVLLIWRRSGRLFCALYLKQCSASLQQAYGGSAPRAHGPLPVFISLTRSGLPSPAFIEL